MIDNETFHRIARENGLDPDQRVAPEVIEKNKKILEKTIKKRSAIAVGLGLFAYFVDVLFFSTKNDTLYVAVIVGICIFEAIALFFEKRTKQNACPKCFAISPWVHFKTWEIGQQRTSITKEVETKHYSSERKPLAGLEFSAGVQRYEGKSVTKITVPAIRYDYRERYKCKCCGQTKDVYTYKIVEQ